MKYIYDIKVVKKVKIINFFCLLLATVMVTSCDYLDEKPLNYLQPEERFQEEAQMELAVHECYSYLNNGYNNVGGSFLDAVILRKKNKMFFSPSSFSIVANSPLIGNCV